ncbi:MAG TPA: isoprenylcysteine carboxylmethyltransferase family protein [Dehalococcoidia bacterium]|nr:isoprenylcysteine carboxylmethyltransferase family protein [Dehalococcoidia bacterium]
MSIWDRYADFVYRVATGDKKRRMLSTPLALLAFFGLIVLFVFASLWIDKQLPVLHFDLAWWNLGLSIFMLVLGWLIMFWPVIDFFRARGTPVPFSPPPKLITTGLYAYVRNPMLLGMFIFLLGLGILFGSLSLVFIFTPSFIVLNVLYLKAIEERELEKKFGDEYLEYKRRVPMFIPRLRRGGKN